MSASTIARTPQALLARLRADSSPESVFWGRVAGTFLSKLVLIPLGLASSVVLARALGPDGRGTFAVLVTIGALGIQFGHLGLPTAGAYFVAADRRRLPAVLGAVLGTALGLGTAIALGVLLLWIAAPGLAPLDSRALLVGGVAWIPFGLLLLLLQNLLLGVHDIRLYNLLQVGHDVASVTLFGALFWVGWRSAEHFYGAAFVAMFAAVVVALRAVLRRADGRVARPRRELLSGLGRYGARSYLATLFAFLVLHFDLLMVARMLGETAAGHYAIAARMGETLYLLPVSLGTILFTTVSSMEQGRWEFTRRTAALLALALPLLLGAAALLARPLVGLLFGEAFLPAVPALLWLLPGVYALSVNTLFMNYFAGIGMPLIAVLSPAAAAVGNIGLNLLLIPRLGIVGASLSSTIAYGFMLLASLLYLRFRTPPADGRPAVGREAGVGARVEEGLGT